VWFLELSKGETFLASYAAIPYEITTGHDLLATKYLPIGGEYVPIQNGPGPSPIQLTLLTSMFMHGSWMHIIGNMVYLLIFGDQIEDRLGRVKFLLFYLLAGISAGLAQVWVAPFSPLPCVGASGAIAGVLGAYLILYPSNAIRVLFFRSIIHLPAFLVLGMWGFMQVAGHLGTPGEQGGVAYMAHIGGFITGLLTSVFLKLFSSGRSPRARGSRW
jgi:membrane associated rhomboid family serine protease